MAVEGECYIKSRNEEVVDKKTKSLMYTKCDLAPDLARAFNMDKGDIHKRVTVSISFVSPVDGKPHTGQIKDDDARVDQFALGSNLKVYAHLNKAETILLH